MKLISLIITVCLMAILNSNSFAQISNTANTTDKNISVQSKATIPTSEMKTDEKGRQYTLVDGRKVLVNENGEQSFVNPDLLDAQPVKKEDPIIGNPK